MADATADHAVHLEEPEDHHRTLGLSNEKFGMWTFLASEIPFFGALISMYVIYMRRYAGGPTQADVFDIPFTAGMTVVLLMSSVAMVLALSALRQGAIRQFQTWTLGAAALGTLFLGAMVYEYTVMHAVYEFSLTTSAMSSAFYALTGFHGFHVMVGILMLLGVWGASVSGRLDHNRPEIVENVGLYWHFVDLVWILIFAVVYLVPSI